ncbi:MAG: DUF541 domain-containing protein [Chloroflexi bacterium]|nr:MAG: DUF541 domain-containing protein [Chloroflexota bacterium]
MTATLRLLAGPLAIVAAISLALVAIAVAANRPALLVGAPSASTSTSTIAPAILTSGDGIVSRKPDVAVIGAGLESQQPTATGAQSDLASKAAKLIARIKSLPVADKDLNTTGCWIGPVYSPQGQTITGYRAAEQLQVSWHNVDTVGRALDAIVQEGGATNISISFGLGDPKPAQAEARTLAIADAKAKALSMASAAGVKLGQVIQVSDLSLSSRVPSPISYGAAASVPTQVPVGQLDIQASVEVDFAIG